MITLLYTHPSFLDHDTGFWHPECADRLRAILAAVDTPEFAKVVRKEPPHASRAALERAHDPTHIDRILTVALPEGEHIHLDSDTVMSDGSIDAALRAAGAVVDAVDEVMAGCADNAFCLVRPPGHHAERREAMGFCLFNNAAIGVLHAKATYRLERIAVVDFDVHHGNGTENILKDEPGTLYISTHQDGAYPGTGSAKTKGGLGQILNCPLPAGTGSDGFRDAYDRLLLPRLETFDPQLLIVSAGFDAHAEDPLANLRLTTEDFAWITERLTAAAARHCRGRLVSVLEGGYDLAALADSASAHLRGLMAATTGSGAANDA